jgi:mRNA interferase MazF
MTTGGQAYPWRVACRFQNRARFVAIDQLRAVDNERMTKRLGRINSKTLHSVLSVLQEMFSI